MQQRRDALRTMILALQATGLIATIATSFIGGLYMFNGNMLYSVPASLFFVVAMFYLVTYFMKEKANRKRRGYPTQFYLALTGYVLLSLVVSFFVLHFYNVEISEKKEIQRIGLSKLECLETVYADYNKKSEEFLRVLSSEIFEKVTELRSNTTNKASVQQQLKDNPYNFSDELIKQWEDPSTNIPDLIDAKTKSMREIFQRKEKSLLSRKEEYFDMQRNIFEGWDRLALNTSIAELNQKLQSDRGELQSLLSDKTAGRFSLEEVGSDCMQLTLIDQPLQLTVKHLGPIALIVIIVFNLLILLPYFLTGGRRY